MAHFTFDERETDQLYVAAKELGNQFLKAKKLAMTLHLSAPALAEIDDQIHRNTELRTMLNPRAEEEARAAARRKRGERSDPRQLDLEHEITVAAEPNGKHARSGKRAKKVSTATVVDGLDVVNPEKTQEPDDEYLLCQMKRAGVEIAPGILNLWSSSDRELALTWANETITRLHESKPDPEGVPMPEALWRAIWSAHYQFDPNVAAGHVLTDTEREYWTTHGPFKVVDDEAHFESAGKKRSKRGSWSVWRFGKHGGYADDKNRYRGKDKGTAEIICSGLNRRSACERLLKEITSRWTTDGWTFAKPARVDDVGAEQVHTAAKEAR